MSILYVHLCELSILCNICIYGILYQQLANHTSACARGICGTDSIYIYISITVCDHIMYCVALPDIPAQALY